MTAFCVVGRRGRRLRIVDGDFSLVGDEPRRIFDGVVHRGRIAGEAVFRRKGHLAGSGIDAPGSFTRYGEACDFVAVVVNEAYGSRIEIVFRIGVVGGNVDRDGLAALTAFGVVGRRGRRLRIVDGDFGRVMMIPPAPGYYRYFYLIEISLMQRCVDIDLVIPSFPIETGILPSKLRLFQRCLDIRFRVVRLQGVMIFRRLGVGLLFVVIIIKSLLRGHTVDIALFQGGFHIVFPGGTQGVRHDTTLSIHHQLPRIDRVTGMDLPQVPFTVFGVVQTHQFLQVTYDFFHDCSLLALSDDVRCRCIR